MDQLRTYIDKQNTVYKLRIAIKNKDLKKAQKDGSDPLTIKGIHNEMVDLVKSFKGWKQDIKKRFEGMTDDQKRAEDLPRKIKHVELEALRLLDLLDASANTGKNNNETHFSTSFCGDKSSSGRRSPSLGGQSANAKYPLNRCEYEKRMSIPLEEHISHERSLSRAEITSEIVSEIKTDITSNQDDDAVFSVEWDVFISYFVPENRKQHEADRLIENTIFKFASYYWKSIRPFIVDGFFVPFEIRSNRRKAAEWTKNRLEALHSIEFRPFPLPKRFDGAMGDYIRFVNDAVIDTATHVLRCSFFEAFRTSKIAEFCAHPSFNIFKALVIDEVTKYYGLFINRQVDNLPANWTHYERMQNERLPTMNKWMMAQIRLQHEIGRLNKAC